MPSPTARRPPAGELVRDIRRAHRSPLAAIRAYAACLAELAASPAALARNLAYLQVDLGDPDFRDRLAAQGRATRAELLELLREAVAAGELKRGTDPRALVRALEVALNGALFTWACYLEGTAAGFMRSVVDAVLAPYRAPRRVSAR